MTVRGGGRPRDDRPMAHPADGGQAADEWWDDRSGQDLGGRPARDRGSGRRSNGGDRPHTGHGLLRFALFAGVLVAAVVLLSVTVLRPVASAAVASWAVDSPSMWRLPFVGEAVETALQPELTAKASADPSDVIWEVRTGDTVDSVADRLLGEELITSRRAFEFAAFQADLADHLTAGSFRLRRDMTPPEVVQALLDARIELTTLNVTFREGLRLEQMVAKLQTVDSSVDPQAFYDLVTKPPVALLKDYPWLHLPDGGTLEGYLYPATYTLRTDPIEPTDAEGLVRMMLDHFAEVVGTARMDVPADRGLTFAEVLTLASIVEKEAALDDERPTIAGVYQNRLDRNKELEADPTVIYAADGAALADLPFEQWQDYYFGTVPKAPDGRLADLQLPDPWDAYNTYAHKGLPPAPICSPTVASIDAALAPDTSTGYLYFVAIPDGGGKHDFSKTFAEHQQKLKKYGYIP